MRRLTSPLLRIALREIRRIHTESVYPFCMLVLPLGCCLFFTSLMEDSLTQATINKDIMARPLPQAIVIDTNATGTSRLDYAVYLSNTILPGILMTVIMLTTVYSLGTELKYNTARQWLAAAHHNVLTALSGKLLPHTLIFLTVVLSLDACLYGLLHYPCHCGIPTLLLLATLLVLSSQALGVFFFALFPSLRLALNLSSLWGIASFSISGFTFPVTSMPSCLQALCNLFPLRHYFLLHASQAFNGSPLHYAWLPIAALSAFIALPLLFIPRLRSALLTYCYIP
ncbi:MAG: ABC transporter permease [Paraprevotella sp.]|nr:ABC transporter permease [Paraprevotella sp.]